MTAQPFSQDPNPSPSGELISAMDLPELRLVSNTPTPAPDHLSELDGAGALPLVTDLPVAVRSPRFVGGTAFNAPTGYLARLIRDTQAQKEAAKAAADARLNELLEARRTPPEVRARIAKQAIEAAGMSKPGPSGWLRRLGFSH